MRVGRSRREGPGTVQRTKTKHSEEKTRSASKQSTAQRTQQLHPRIEVRGQRCVAPPCQDHRDCPGQQRAQQAGRKVLQQGAQQGATASRVLPGADPEAKALVEVSQLPQREVRRSQRPFACKLFPCQVAKPRWCVLCSPPCVHSGAPRPPPPGRWPEACARRASLPHTPPPPRPR